MVEDRSAKVGGSADRSAIITGDRNTATISITNYYYRENTIVVPIDTENENLPCPYRGLFHFSPDDAEFFFGHQVFVEELFIATQNRNFIPVLGASGSGKSSVVLAGLVPKLQKEGYWKFTHFRPGADPFQALALALVPLYTQDLNATELIVQARQLAGYLREGTVSLTDVFVKIHKNYRGYRVLLIADQFEELYTLCAEQKVRRSFLDVLLACFGVYDSTKVLMTTMRADFLGNALSYRPLLDVLQNADIKLGSMNRFELRQVIEKPASKLGVTFEVGLVERVLDDIEDEPGNLPLLEFALTQLWKRRNGKQLTHAAYEEIGEVSGALTRHADDNYGRLSATEKEQVRRIFIQLVRPGEGTEDTRRLATKAELGEANWKLVKQLADKRLLVTSQNAANQETVEVVHEALISNWGEFQQWINADRSFRLWQEQLRVAIYQWECSNFDNGALFRGKPLLDAQDWQQKRASELCSRERNFIERSLVVCELEKQRKQRRRQLIFYGLVSGLVVTSTLAVVAWWGWRSSFISQIQAINESSQALFASDQKLDALKQAIEAKRKLRKLGKADTDTQLKSESVLRRAVYGAVEYNRLEGHTNEVKSVFFSPDGSILASTSRDRTVKLWKQDGTFLKTLLGHSAGVLDVAISPDSQTIASASEDKTINLWNRDGMLLHTLKGHDAAVNEVAFSPDGNILASASHDHSIKLWSISGKPILIKTLKGHQNAVEAITFSRDGDTIASASEDQTIKLWNKDGTFLTTLTGHKDIVWDVAISPDGNTIASASKDKTIKLWNKDGKLLNTLEGYHQDAVSAVTFSPDGKMLASASWDNTVKIWNNEGTLLTTLNAHSDRVWKVAFSPNSKILASVSGDNTIKFWKLDNELLSTLRGHSAPVIGVAISPKSPMVASASDDGTIILWSQDTTLPVKLDHKASVYAVAFSPDGNTIASAGADSMIKLWNKNSTLLSTLKGHTKGIWALAISPDGNMIVSGGWDKTVKLWNKNGNEFELKTLEAHQEIIWDVAISPKDNTIASAGSDGTVKLWNKNGTFIKTLKEHTADVWGVAFSPDGNRIATASDDKTVKLWNKDGTFLTTLEKHQSTVFGVAFSPDGKLLASASADKTVKLWNVEKEKPALLVTLNGHNNRVWGVAFSPDSKTLASASDDKTVIWWQIDHVVDLDKILKSGCDWIRDYLKTNEHVSKSERRICD